MRWLACVNLRDEAADGVVASAAAWARIAQATVDVLFVDEASAVPGWVTDPLSSQMLASGFAAAKTSQKLRLQTLLELIPAENRGSAVHVEGRPVDAILDWAPNYALVALAGRKHSVIGRALLGSVAAQVSRTCPTPVFVFPADAPSVPQGRPRALVGVDLRDPASTALPRKAEWVGWLDAVADCVHVDSGRLHVPYILDRDVRERFEVEWEQLRQRDLQALTQAMSAIPVSNRGLPRLEDGDPAEVLLGLASEYDVLVVATHGRTGLQRLMLGSVAEKIAQGTPKPLLLLRA
jgi:nucleotide-binding universal stress UspA family protein